LLLDYGAIVNLPPSGGNGNALDAAIEKKAEQVYQLLIDQGGDIHAIGYYGSSLQAACYTENEALVGVLLHKEVDVNLVGGKYCTALRDALTNGNETITKLLLENGAEVNQRIKGYHITVTSSPTIVRCHTAIKVAAASNNIAVVQMVLDRGADINASTEKRTSVLSRAVQCPDPSMLKFVLSKGADATRTGGLALYITASEGDTEKTVIAESWSRRKFRR
jgi:ankyrin repeat protein